MAEFMSEHPNLAKNILPNCGQGKAVAKRLWEQLTIKLNKYGPPIKEEKLWRKVYADQKHNVKKKVSFNKASKKKTGGGPYEEKLLTCAEEQILEAAGIEPSVDGLCTTKTFGSSQTTKQICNDQVEEALNVMLDDEDNEEEQEEIEKEPIIKPKKGNEGESKLNLLKCHMEKYEDSQQAINSKLDRLLSLKERSLKLKEEEHAASMAIKKIDFELKSIELEMLKLNVDVSK